mgnify:CR=1 FL=1
MKILVLGAAGMAGHVICLYLKSKGHDVSAFSRTKFPYCKSLIGDASNFVKLEEIVKKGKYDAVINCIGVLNNFAEEHKCNAVLMNSYLPHFLATITKDIPTKVVHMSTDCVFSGKMGGYIETDFTDGTTFYDRSKALGELNDSKNITFRNSIIGPDINKDGIGLFNWFMKQNGTINGYSKAIWTGVTTLTLAKAIEQSLDEDVAGLVNLVNNTSINKFELLCLFNKYFRSSELCIVPSEAVYVDKSLVRTRMDFSFIVPSYEQMMVEMAEWVNANKSLYPHYFG